MRTAKGYTLIELAIIIMFIGILTAIAVPRIDFGAISRQKAGTVARKIILDLRRARNLALSDAANNNQGYELEMIGGSPYNGYRIKNRDTAAVVETFIIDTEISCTGGATFGFSPLGNMESAGTQLDLSANGKTYTITITPATGMIQCTEN